MSKQKVGRLREMRRKAYAEGLHCGFIEVDKLKKELEAKTELLLRFKAFMLEEGISELEIAEVIDGCDPHETGGVKQNCDTCWWWDVVPCPHYGLCGRHLLCWKPKDAPEPRDEKVRGSNRQCENSKCEACHSRLTIREMVGGKHPWEEEEEKSAPRKDEVGEIASLEASVEYERRKVKALEAGLKAEPKPSDKASPRYKVDFYDMIDGWIHIHDNRHDFNDLDTAKRFCDEKNLKLDPQNKSAGEHWGVIDLGRGIEVYHNPYPKEAKQP